MTNEIAGEPLKVRGARGATPVYFAAFGLGVFGYAWGKVGFWWALLYGFFWPAWLGFRVAEALALGAVK